MKTEYVVVVALAVLATACQSGLTSPTIVPPPSVPAVATEIPNVWDSASELRAWVNNGASTGAVTVVGEGKDAVIRVDVSRDANLHGPDFDPPLTGITAARLRYRWVDKGPGDVLFMDMYLRPPTLDANLDIPKLFYIPSDLSRPPQNASGNWVDELFTGHGMSNPPYSVRFATLSISGSGTYAPAAIHGFIEIDSIALIR